jgi:glycosyltransferase involved in cell wall biosynthesis
VVVGDGPGRAELARRTAPPLDGRVFLTGRVDEATLHALYARADVFVHASRFEGSSLVTLEAMAHGLPVLATRAGGIPDKVEDGLTGRLVAPGDVAALAAAIAAVAHDRSRAEMGRRGRERVLESFAWPAIAERTIALYRDLTEGRS